MFTVKQRYLSLFFIISLSKWSCDQCRSTNTMLKTWVTFRLLLITKVYSVTSVYQKYFKTPLWGVSPPEDVRNVWYHSFGSCVWSFELSTVLCLAKNCPHFLPSLVVLSTPTLLQCAEPQSPTVTVLQWSLQLFVLRDKNERYKGMQCFPTVAYVFFSVVDMGWCL